MVILHSYLQWILSIGVTRPLLRKKVAAARPRCPQRSPFKLAHNALKKPRFEPVDVIVNRMPTFENASNSAEEGVSGSKHTRVGNNSASFDPLFEVPLTSI